MHEDRQQGSVEPPHTRDAAILTARPARNRVDAWRPYAFHVEPERSATGQIQQAATIFLTSSECPFRCLMCDLWKNTIEGPVPAGAIPAQIDYALDRLPPADVVKLYNSGNFFDRRAVPESDWPAIADRVRRFQTVIVENHPRLCGDGCLRFRDVLRTHLEVALGLETIHPEVLPALHKRMTVEDFDRAAGFLVEADIGVRAFVLVRPPFLSDEEGVEWAVRSVEHAFDAGASCCALIPVRGGNGIMEALAAGQRFAPPTLAAFERAFDQSLELRRGRVFADLWDVERLARCPGCAAARIERLSQMNLMQVVLPRVPCDCGARA